MVAFSKLQALLGRKEEEDPYELNIEEMLQNQEPPSYMPDDRSAINDARKFEDVASIGSSLQKLGSLNGEYYKSDLPEFAQTQTKRLQQDIGNRRAGESQRQKDLIGKYDLLLKGKREERIGNQANDEMQRRLTEGLGRLENLSEKNRLLGERDALKKEKDESKGNKLSTTLETDLRKTLAKTAELHGSAKEGLDKIEGLIKSYPYPTTANINPEKWWSGEGSELKREIRDLATSYIKSVDQNSVIQPSEMDTAMENIFNKGPSKVSALNMVKNVREIINRRIKNRIKSYKAGYGEDFEKYYKPFKDQFEGLDNVVNEVGNKIELPKSNIIKENGKEYTMAKGKKILVEEE